MAIETVMTGYASDGGEVAAYQARPEGDGPFPGVLVIMEWWGLDDHIKDVTERFAREGYFALAPDIYHGTVIGYDDAETAMQTVRSFDREQAVSELSSAVSHMKRQPFSSGKVGVIGYCMGGGFALLTAIDSDEVDAVNPYYGGNPDPIDLVEHIECPVLGLYAGRDEANRPSVPDIEAALERHGREFECIVYPDAPHAFFNDRSETYRAEPAEDAWERTKAFFAQHLR